jgi:hypothetical protein
LCSTQWHGGLERGIGREALQPRNLQGRPPFVLEQAGGLAQHLDGTDARAGPAEQVLFEDRRACGRRLVAGDRSDEGGHVNSRGTRGHAGGLRIRTAALQTAVRLRDRLDSRE